MFYALLFSIFYGSVVFSSLLVFKCVLFLEEMDKNRHFLLGLVDEMTSEGRMTCYPTPRASEWHPTKTVLCAKCQAVI